MSVHEAAQEGRLAALLATRDALAAAIDAGGGTIAQNVAQFRAVLVEIDEIRGATTPAGEETGLDEFTRKLHERTGGAGAKAPGRSASR